MTKRMLIDASHAEETRVVVLDGNRLEDFDLETSAKRQLKGNIYLAKVVRVEPSLQAAFVDYGGNRHGFLAFSEIHPDYYQIPVADRLRLVEMQAEEALREQEEEDRAAEAEGFRGQAEPVGSDAEAEGEPKREVPAVSEAEETQSPVAAPLEIEADAVASRPEPEVPDQPAPAPELLSAESADESGGTVELLEEANSGQVDEGLEPSEEAEAEAEEERMEEPAPETIGGESDGEFRRERRIPPRFLRQYKIQEVIHRRQILLVQVVKEERGTKGAALTSYISLAGRYCVLMPNSPRGGGISRKITSPADRRRLKEVIAELDLPRGMGLIVRTAGANRPKPEIKRDCEYLLRLWDDVREHTLRSIAPALIYEEANLIKRTIRDVYSRDVDEIAVDGEEGWKAARDFMRMLMPSHAKKVQLWQDTTGQRLFARHQVDAQLDAILNPIVQLRSGGYLVINQAEALVAIDVNSGRSTRERGIEETALRTNMEAADEVARQLRLRDLAGLVVIDFIDMESRKHNGMVERRLKEALKADRARIQVGHISHFGLLEMSWQRLRPSFAETSLIMCPHCGGTGHIRTVESAAIHVLRAVEEEGGKRRAAEILVHTTPTIALYIFNYKRQRLAEIESRYAMRVMILTQDGMISPPYRIERVRAQAAEPQPVITPELVQVAAETEAQEAPSGSVEPGEEETVGDGKDAEGRRRRRRRRRGARREEQVADAGQVGGESGVAEPIEGVPEMAEPPSGDDPGRREGRRRGHRQRRDESLPGVAEPGAAQPELPPLYAGPTPADPYGGQVFDIFDAIEAAQAGPGLVSPEPAPLTERALPTVAAPPPLTEPITDVEPEPETTLAAAPEPAPTAELHPAEQPPAPANDPEPLVKPIIVGAEEAPVEKKRGWWRR